MKKKIVKSLEDFGLLLKGCSETIHNEPKEQKGAFLSNLSGTLGASLLGNMLTVKGIIRAGYGSKGSSIKKNLIPPHPLTNVEIQKSIIKMNQDLTEFILGIIYLIK